MVPRPLASHLSAPWCDARGQPGGASGSLRSGPQGSLKPGEAPCTHRGIATGTQGSSAPGLCVSLE